MSGIVGIVNFDGAPVDRALLSRMTASLDFRGPDSNNMWVEGSGGFSQCVGFGHTLLRTTYEAEHEQQPFTFDGKTFIVADCRIDARRELIAKLNAKGRDASLHRPDVELILHAWHVWGEECVEHLLGDFAFAIWDGRRLFCARDHMGVKPFYYAHIGSAILFSNTLDCVRLHPRVSDRLNDLAIADFLLFELNQDPATTSFADIQRIPPAHRVTWSARGMKTSRYWALPIDEPVYFKRASDYVDRFKELLHQVVDDRIRTRRIAVFMSGGLDSTTLAATAHRLLGKPGGEQRVHAFTNFFTGYDSDRVYAKLVADHLGIPIYFRDGLAEGIPQRWEETPIHMPEPSATPMNLKGHLDHYRRITAFSRVVFYGEGPDNALRFEWRAYISYLMGKKQYLRLLSDVATHMLVHKRVPLVPTIPRMFNEWRARGQWSAFFPPWLNPDLEQRLDLRTRWAEQQAPLASDHPVHPVAHAYLQSAQWQALFEELDSERTFEPLETRHPFMDVRMLRYCLSVPVIPWCRTKYLLRKSQIGILPEIVRCRPKSTVEGDAAFDWFRRMGLRPFHASDTLLRYVRPTTIPESLDRSVAFWTNFRPRSLDYWLQCIDMKIQNVHKEECSETIR